MTADFLVIGAQKCGTTTLYEDMRSHDGIHIPDKETSRLLDRPDAGQYAAMFARARPGQLRGEVATTYSMSPEYDGVPELAKALAPNARIIYIVRNPIERVVSHHYHDLGLGLVADGNINTAVRSYAPLIQNSRYATQIRPWIKLFGASNLLVLRFEDYVKDRQAGVRSVQEFLGLDWQPLPSEEAHNSSEDKKVPTGLVNRISASPFYRRVLRPMVSERMRRGVTRGLSKEQPKRPAPPSDETRAYLVEVLEPEVRDLARLTGSEPFWDLQAYHAES